MGDVFEPRSRLVEEGEDVVIFLMYTIIQSDYLFSLPDENKIPNLPILVHHIGDSPVVRDIVPS